MNIKQTPEIKEFMARCFANATSDYKNDFLGIEVTKENEYEIQAALREAGFAEFFGKESTWPTLFINTKEYLKSPYQSTIRLDHIQAGEFHFSLETMPANQLFHVGSVNNDPMHELNDWMTLRALDESYEAAVLWQGNEVWMLDSPSEANTINPFAKKAHGKVLTFGLGIGYFIYMALQNPDVTSITVIEQSAAVISMFETYILPQFPSHISVHLVQGDAYMYFNQAYISNFDYVFVDIWKSNEDGYLHISKLLEQYQPDFDSVDFWIESSCFEHLPTMVFLYYQAQLNKLPVTHDDPFYFDTLQKVATYLDGLDITIDDVAQLKHFMYDPRVLRAIAGTVVDQKITGSTL